VAEIKISYILTTYNKYKYLKITLPYTISQLLPNEELIIVDGNSKDESVQFITELVKSNQNITFISQPDRGESHGLNKALLLCKGQLIKNLTDDDAFSFYAVRKAADYMLANDIDIMGFDGYGLSLHHSNIAFGKTEFYAAYQNYSKDRCPFFFCGLSYLIKRSSLPLLGLFSVNYKMVDLEYSYRISSAKCKIGWSNLAMFVNIYNAQSNTLLFNKQLEKESTELHKKYASRTKYFTVFLRFKLQRLLEFKNILIRREPFGKSNKLDFEKGFYESIELLEKENSGLEKINFY
jgi:glycosyltransferase involved in cell wall biosynthesis